ncbi:fumarylacetoacetate hydrolase family protein [Andreprevotia chitinilytica]|uniref:fumarylacetoacetate hydrolase family protein n=1 Tax=Andreprevotia chitinilytica TaxID=396808 RepID=UPI00054F5481|nr:fumarylacetoacetate hydrolase family protein [Andreprevotia chitinilytica]
MKRARIHWQGQAYDVTVGDDNRVTLPDGRTLAETEVQWLPPASGTIFALGLNYADHAAELAFKAPTEPLVFIKAPNTLTGHRQVSVRPDNVEYMHYEAELVVVIGKTARNVKREDAMAYVGGYTVCNDYAVRDFLENYYRPNLRVKSRDTLTPIGPWIVDAADVADPGNLTLRTYVNGELRQQGSTRDLIFDIPYLIEYLSGFMTLSPGDMIATGTPEGLADVKPGDEVIVEVEQVGRLVNHIVSEADYEATLSVSAQEQQA